MIQVYTDGACLGNPGPGGWAAVVVSEGKRQEFARKKANTTNNRMEVTAAIEALAHTPPGSEVTVHSDSRYLVYTMNGKYRRRANLDLWEKLDTLAAQRKVSWVWLRSHTGHPEMERAHLLANEKAGIRAEARIPTHFDASGRVRMVDISEKPETERVAVAKGTVVMKQATLELIRQGQAAKGDVLATAQMAGIMAAKETPHLIPLCHPLMLTDVAVDIELDEGKSAALITATAKTTGKTGVEMEALTAVAVSALTIYDMCKAVDRTMRIGDIRLVEKSGGRSGSIILE